MENSDNLKKAEAKLLRVLTNTFDFKEYHTKIKNAYFKSNTEVYSFLCDPSNKDYIVNMIAKDSKTTKFLNKIYMKKLNNLYQSYKKENKITLEDEVNQTIDKIINEYDKKDYYTTGKRSNYLLSVLNDLFETIFEKHLDEGNKVNQFFQNPKTQKKIILKIGKDKQYDLNYLNSIYYDLLRGISLKYDFEGNEFNKKKSTLAIVFSIILGIILVIVIGIISFGTVFYVVPIVFLVSFFWHLKGR